MSHHDSLSTPFTSFRTCHPNLSLEDALRVVFADFAFLGTGLRRVVVDAIFGHFLRDMHFGISSQAGHVGHQGDAKPVAIACEWDDEWSGAVQGGRLEADLGYTWLDFKCNADDHSGIFFRANGRYDFAEHTVGTLTLSRTFSDAVQFLQVDPSQIGQVVIGSGLNGALVSPSVYKEDRVSGSLDQGGQTYTLSFTPFSY